MQLTIKGKNMQVTDEVRDHVTKKVGKLDRYLDGIIEARIDLFRESTRSLNEQQAVQITLTTNGTILRSEERAADVFTALDAALAKIHRQITRYKERRESKPKASAGTAAAAEAATPELPEAAPETEEAAYTIVREKRFPIKPMFSEEAIEQMELLGHDFFVFVNAETEAISVVYRRTDGNYGLLIPETI